MSKPFYQAGSDQQLANLLHELFIVQGQPEVEINHPTDGSRVITRAEYDDAIRIEKLPPAKRVEEMSNIARRNTMQLATWLNETDVTECDIDDPRGYGKDADGNDMEIQGLVFVPVDEYPEGVLQRHNEFGAFVDESLKRKPIRVAHLEGQSLLVSP